MISFNYLVKGLVVLACLMIGVIHAEDSSQKTRLSRAKEAAGDDYVALRNEILKDPRSSDFLKSIQKSSASPSERLLAEILQSRLTASEDLLKLEQEFHDKVFLVYHAYPNSSHVPIDPRVTLDGLLIPEEKTPCELEPERFKDLGAPTTQGMGMYFESIRVSSSPLWGLFCCEVAWKGWVPMGKKVQAPPSRIASGQAMPLDEPFKTEKKVTDEEYVGQAITLLGKLHEHRAEPILFPILQDKAAPSIRRAMASIALGRLQHSESLPLLIERCEKTHDQIDPLEREAAFEAIVLMNDRSIIPRLQGIITVLTAKAEKREQEAKDASIRGVTIPFDRDANHQELLHNASAQRAIDKLMTSH